MSDLELNMITNFLKRNYPIIRAKQQNRFKRAILMDNGRTYILSDQTTNNELKTQLIKVLKTVFDLDEKYLKTVLKDVMNL